MALKVKIDKATYDALSDAVKAEYIADGEGFKLDVDDTDIAAEMRRARDREKQERADLQKERDRIQGELDALKGEGHRKAGDIDAIEASWRTKVEAEKVAGKTKSEKLEGQLRNLLVNDVARAMATEISTSPALILPHIKARLRAEFDGDEPVTKVLDESGKLSALTVAELKQSFIDNKEFAAIIIGSKASGSGATGTNGGGASKKPSEYTEAERVALYHSNREEFRRLFPQSS